MPKDHYELSKKVVLKTSISVISFLAIALISMIIFFEKKQTSNITGNTETLQTTMQQMMKQDKAAGIIAKDLENHKDNQTAHVK